jgi:hypothetical protein
MNDRWFLDRFLDIAGRHNPESYFLDALTLPWAGGDDYSGPQKFVCDLVEIDGRGRMHLWVFAHHRAAELLSGEVIGRMFACTQVFCLAPMPVVRSRLEKAARRRRYDVGSDRFRAVLKKPRVTFDSWNLVACGGRGCELAGEDSLVRRLYGPLSTLVEHIQDVNTWHFYQTATGFDLRSIWDFSLSGRLSLEEKLAIYDGRRHLAPAPDDDFDIAVKHDLHLKRRKGFHAQGHEAWFGDRGQILAR